MVSTGVNPLFENNAIEGLWTIPVCDISAAADQSYPGKLNILQPYESSNAQWCGPICNNDDDTTREFFEATNMVYEGFAMTDYPFVRNCAGSTAY